MASASDNFSSGSIGTTWLIATGGGNASISGGQLTTNHLDIHRTLYFAATAPATADQEVEVAVLKPGFPQFMDGGPAVRLTTAGNGYAASLSGNRVRIYRLDAGTPTELASVARTMTSGDVLKLKIVGDDLEAHVNGVLQVSATDATYTASAQWGIFGVTNALSFDNWSATDVAAGGLTLTLPHIASAATLHTPTVTPGAVSLTLPAIASAATLHAMTVSPGAVTLGLPTIASSAVMHTPGVAPGAVFLALPHISSAAVLHAMSLGAGTLTLVLPHIASAALLHAPGVAPGPVTLALPQIASTAQLFTPQVTPGAVSLGLPTIASSAALFTPTAIPGAVSLFLPTISGTILHVPIITGGLQINREQYIRVPLPLSEVVARLTGAFPLRDVSSRLKP